MEVNTRRAIDRGSVAPAAAGRTDLAAVAGDVSRPAGKRLAACDRLVRAGRFAEAEPVLGELAQLPEHARHARRLIAAGQHIARWLGQDGPDTLSRLNGAVMRRHPDAARTLLVFTGQARQVWVSISLFDRFLRQFPINAIYLTEESGFAYMDGIAGFGASYPAALAGMRAAVAGLGAPALCCLGTSSGGDAALRYGLDLGADRVLAFSPYLDMRRSALFNERFPAMVLDVAVLYRRAARIPEVRIVFGAANAGDRATAGRFASLPGATLDPIAGYERHDVIPELIATGRLQPLLAGLLG